MLEEYVRKRNFKSTSEPGAHQIKSRTADLQFVVQKHNARRLHYDFRIECNGVLLSWAVPKGPSLDPSVKHLAVMVEDHPFDYRNFEGVIPPGQYGAGQVIVWDKGVFTVEEHGKPLWNDRLHSEKLIRQGLRQGKLSLWLKGIKLKGAWALIRLKRGENQWLLIKDNDQFANGQTDITEEDQSVNSGKTIEDLKSQTKKRTGIKEVKSPTLGVSRFGDGKKSSQTTKALSDLKPMLAQLASAPFAEPGWLYEPKLDGIRGLAYITKGKVKLSSRRALDLTARYPKIVKELAKQGEAMILDGEIVALDKKGQPSFELLQQRSGLCLVKDGQKAEGEIPVFYYVFDILWLDGQDLRSKPLLERKRILNTALTSSTHIRLTEELHCDGKTAFAVCIDNGLEGVVAKRCQSIYESGRRSANWLKIKGVNSAEFIICGFTAGAGTRKNDFGSLLLGYYGGGSKITFAGGVGSGFDGKSLAKLMNIMNPLITEKCPFPKYIPNGRKAKWLKPKLVAEVKFANWTKDKKLRAPVFIRLREDVAPEQTGPNLVFEPKSAMARVPK